MYKLHEKKKVNINDEIRAMTEFVTARWNSVAGVDELLKRLAKRAKQQVSCDVNGRQLHYELHGLAIKRRAIVEGFSDNTDVEFYDQPYLLLESMASMVYKLGEKAGKLERLVDMTEDVKRNLGPELSHLKRAQPKGFRAMLQHREADDDEWDKARENEGPDSALFEGADVGSESAGSFVFSVSIVLTVQNKAMHDTPPIDDLIEGAYRHFLSLYRHINTQAILADVKQVEPYIEEAEPVFEMPFIAKHKLTKMLEGFAREEWLGAYDTDPRQEYLENLEKIREDNARTSKEEIAAIKKSEEESRAEIAALWQSVLNRAKVGAAKPTSRRAKR